MTNLSGTTWTNGSDENPRKLERLDAACLHWPTQHAAHLELFSPSANSCDAATSWPVESGGRDATAGSKARPAAILADVFFLPRSGCKRRRRGSESCPVQSRTTRQTW